ncbi:unnamed protein product [Caenorhabditis brenneri]
MKLILWIFSVFAVSNGCFKVRRFNECGCFDYKPLSFNHISKLDRQLSKELTKGNFTNPIFIYENCSYIHMECDQKSGNIRRLLRTNWPERGMVYSVDMNSRTRTSTLWFNVKCDKETHEWKYLEVENDLEIVTEHVTCYSF